MYYVMGLWLFIFILTALLIKQLKIKTNYIICFFLTILIILFVININSSMQAAVEGCKLWFSAILPTIFPFLVICNLLIAYDGITLYSSILGPLICRPLNFSRASAFPITASILCGYPLGAKYCSDIYSQGYISKKEYLRLLNIATNCSPLFIIGPVATVMLGNVKFAYILLAANYLAPFIMSIFTRKIDYPIFNNVTSSNIENIDFGTNFKNALSDAVKTSISIGAFIVIFSVIISMIKSNVYINIAFQKLELLINIPKNSLYSLFLGSIEITNGCNLISQSDLGLSLKLSIISFLCSFSGLCIIAQVSSFISQHKVSLIKYTVKKLFQGIISGVLTFIISLFTITSLETSSITINNESIDYHLYFVPVIFILGLTLVLAILKKLFFHVS